MPGQQVVYLLSIREEHPRKSRVILQESNLYPETQPEQTGRTSNTISPSPSLREYERTLTPSQLRSSQEEMFKKPTINNNKTRQRNKFYRRLIYLFGCSFITVIILSLIACIIALAVPQKSTTTTTTTTTATTTTTTTSSTSSTSSTSTSTSSTTSTSQTTSTTTSCTSVPSSNLLQSNGGSSWALYSFNYTASTTAPTLTFGFTNGGADTNYLDTVSVVNVNIPSIELIQNPDFENSTVALNGWTTWCTSGCGSGNEGQVSTSSCHSGNCYKDHCQHPIYDYLAQSFSATIGDTYTISFWLYQSGGGAGKFYANIDG
ncbi:unnamed protein product [Adineta ricciae]|uniref:Uncharacterized protein n=1 Tax=Adineta ricciae TaxID=249248 RepID=A0A814JX48_ADIRI|nr:unnamed protein product [Adineta ricciae]CAF1296304.1 unnamed protein product [Adineta ricciae]